MTGKRVLEIDFVGRDKASNKVFETTLENVAIAENMREENRVYRPLIVLEGGNELLPGIEKALLAMKKNETKKITLAAEEAFGPRDPEMVRVMPMKEFTRRKINPVPGLVVEADRFQGRVQSVSGGRVRVDFNHPLAGKTVEFELTAKNEFLTDADKTNALFIKFFAPEQAEKGKPKPSVNVTKTEVEVLLPGLAGGNVQGLKQGFAQAVINATDGIQTVRFSEKIERGKNAAGKPAQPGHETHDHDEHDHD